MIPDLARHTEKLFYFFQVANEGSLHATSRKIGTSAPTISYAIKQLEEVAGAQLFVRSQKGSRLTPAGNMLYQFCERYYRDLDEVSRLMHQPLRVLPTKIKVGTFQSIAIYFWPLLLDSLKGNKNLSLSMKTGRSREIMESLVQKQIDLAVTVETFRHPNLIRHELYRDHYGFYCATKLKTKRIRRSNIDMYNLLYIPNAYDKNRKTLKQYINSWALVFRDEFEMDSLEVICEFVNKGYGIGILPTLVARTYGAGIKKVGIEGVDEGVFGEHRFFMSYRDDLELPQKLMDTFLESARKAVGQVHKR